MSGSHKCGSLFKECPRINTTRTEKAGKWTLSEDCFCQITKSGLSVFRWLSQPQQGQLCSLEHTCKCHAEVPKGIKSIRVPDLISQRHWWTTKQSLLVINFFRLHVTSIIQNTLDNSFSYLCVKCHWKQGNYCVFLTVYI